MPAPVIIKVGGSLIYHEGGQTLRRLGSIIQRLSLKYPLFIIPGGGPFADCIRQYGEQLKLSEQTSHFMALLAMDQFAFLLRELIPGSRLLELSSSQSFCYSALITEPQILLCSRYISSLSPRELPQSWAVTSDSIAAYLANRLGASLLILVKSKDIDPEVKEPDVDAYFQASLSPDLPVWFLNGLYPERLAQLLETGRTQGVRLLPKLTGPPKNREL
ncbi:MAG: hypothetical protein M0T74_13045 [Desulfitobacterium hafniense]|nr:hypothetical protein [Desulfitobacterium hafniense]